MGESIIFIACVVGAAFIGTGAFFIGTDNPSDWAKFGVVCEYEGGTVADDLCIKNDRVITIDMEND